MVYRQLRILTRGGVQLEDLNLSDFLGTIFILIHFFLINTTLFFLYNLFPIPNFKVESSSSLIYFNLASKEGVYSYALLIILACKSVVTSEVLVWVRRFPLRPLRLLRLHFYRVLAAFNKNSITD